LKLQQELVGPHPLPIPERVIGIENMLPGITTASVTKVVIPQKWRYNSSVGGVSLGTWTHTSTGMYCIHSSSKCPYVSPGMTKSDAYSIHIVSIECKSLVIMVRFKRKRLVLHTGNHSPSHSPSHTPCYTLHSELQMSNQYIQV